MQDSLTEKVKLLENELAKALSLLADSDKPCFACNLPIEDWNKCEHGFPGCIRADALLNSSMTDQQLSREIAAYEMGRKTERELIYTWLVKHNVELADHVKSCSHLKEEE